MGRSVCLFQQYDTAVLVSLWAKAHKTHLDTIVSFHNCIHRIECYRNFFDCCLPYGQQK